MNANRLETSSSSDSYSEKGLALNFKFQRGECSLRKLSRKISGEEVPTGPGANPSKCSSLESPITDLLIDFEQTFMADFIETDNVGGNTIGPELVNQSHCTSIDSPLQAHLVDLVPNDPIDPGKENEEVLSSGLNSFQPIVYTSLESPFLAHLNELELAFVKANTNLHQESEEGAVCANDIVGESKANPSLIKVAEDNLKNIDSKAERFGWSEDLRKERAKWLGDL
ncbi:hypothetical protein QYF36_007954 [Acer negundo]|nr:hypothetical protein QYF36_007954 [Acer negundo]